jgi:cystathionine gamma-synthase
MQKQVRQFESRAIGGEFGISVELPTLQDVVDYEEDRIVLTHGYPRFVAHSVIADKENLARVSTGMPFAVAFPSLKQAHFISNDYIQRYCPQRGFFSLDVSSLLFMNSIHTGRKSSRVVGDPNSLIIVEVNGVTVACLKHKRDFDRLRSLRRTWGSGFDVHDLSDIALPFDGDPEPSLVDAVCELEGESARGALFFQSGMAAISSVALLSVYLKRRFIVVGATYVDTETIANTWCDELAPLECVRLPDNVSGQALETELEKGPALVFFEMPTNPRLTVVDLPAVSSAAQKHDALVAVDGTIITPFNMRLLDRGADIVLHSSSKFLSGGLNHLGGVLTSSSKEILALLDEIKTSLDLAMCRNQQIVLLRNLEGFERRMQAINRNTEAIVSRLQASDDIAQVFYPGVVGADQENLAQALFSPGRSGLVSFLLKDGTREGLARFYDNVSAPVMKGPGFGGETSLLCPYVMLAHYHDDKAVLDKLGLDFHLIRLSVGVEPLDDIWHALRLH